MYGIGKELIVFELTKRQRNGEKYAETIFYIKKKNYWKAIPRRLHISLPPVPL